MTDAAVKVVAASKALTQVMLNLAACAGLLFVIQAVMSAVVVGLTATWLRLDQLIEDHETRKGGKDAHGG